VKTLVTGGAGFIGSALARRLLRLGHEVYVVDDLSNSTRENVPEGVKEFWRMDFFDVAAYNAVQFDCIFHLAAPSSGSKSFENPHKELEEHVWKTYELLEWAYSVSSRMKFIYTSSATVYGNQAEPVDELEPLSPKTPYAAGKAAAEAYVKYFANRGLQANVVRLPAVYGPGQNLQNREQGMVSIYLSYILAKKRVLVKGLPIRYRDFIYVEDAVEGMLAVMDNTMCRRTYNLSTGIGTTVHDLLMLMFRISGHQEGYEVDERGTPGDQFGIVLDPARARDELDWEAKTDLITGLKLMYAFEKERSEQNG